LVPEEIALDERSVKLCWDMNGAARRVEPTPELLREFLTIGEIKTWEQNYAAVLKFAQKWGPLHLCYEHVRPVWHTLDMRNVPFGGPTAPSCPPERRADGRFAEWVWAWLSYASTARDVVHAAALLRAGEARPTHRRERQIVDILRVKPERDALTLRVQTWLEDGVGLTVLPKWTSDDEAPVWRAEVHTLAAALAVALWNTLRVSPGMAVCAHCLRLFEIRQGNQRYCDQPTCQTERKRAEKARTRAMQAGSNAPDPEYTI